MQIVIDKHVAVAMRDGVELSTDVYRLAGAEPAPVLVQRLPYDKELRGMTDASLDVLRAVQAGFVVVVQDTRGRFRSGGAFDPFFDEGADGADTVAWAAAQPWSSGRVGMCGSSYFGATQWLAAAEDPPALEAIAPYITSADYRRWMFTGGAFELGFVLNWTLLFLALGDAQRRLGEDAGVLGEIGELIAAVDDNDTLYRRLPLIDMPLISESAPYYRTWMEHPEPDAFWEPITPEHADGPLAPALVVGGWFDLFLGGTLASYASLRDRGDGPPPRLVVGPWAHGNDSGVFPERNFGVLAGRDGVDLTALHLRWFTRHLTDTDDGLDEEPPVKLFVMGADEWRDVADWPPPDAVATPWFLRADGMLSPERPGDEPPDEFDYDPGDPVPTLGGATFLPGLAVSANAGPRDQSPLDARSDVLRFVSAPLEHDVEVIGPIELVLFASSSAADTDFTAKLVDVHPGGSALALADGILRARYRDAPDAPRPLEPGAMYELRIEVGATANRFLAGHRIRLDVSSSNFPRFDRNTNSGGTIARETAADFVVATNRVLHSGEHASHLVLPIVDAAR